MKFLRHVRKYILFELLILFILSLTPLLWFGNGSVIIGHDSGFRFNITHHMEMLWNTFNPSVNTGVDWSLYKGFLIIQLPELILQNIFGSLEVAQPLVFIFWFFLMGISMYGAMLFLFPEKNKWFLRLYTSIFWIFNFYILQAWFIAERAKFSLYAALPVSIVLFIAVFEKRISVIRGAILFGLLYFFCNGGGSPPLFGASVIVWFLTWSFFSLLELKAKGIPSLIRSISIIFSFLGMFFLLNSYWILPQIDLIRGTYSGAVSSEGGVEGIIAWEREISKFASIPNLLRLQGIPDWYNNASHPFSQQFLHNPLLIFFSYIPVMSICLGILFFRKKTSHRHKYFLWLVFILLVVGLFFSAGSHAPTGFIYLLLMRKIPGFIIFRSSLYKFAPVLWLSIIVLSGYFLQLGIDHMNKIKTIGVMILVGLLIYHFPFFFPNFFQFSSDFTTRVHLPLYVQSIARELDQKIDSGRVLLVPELDKGFINKPIDTYNWGYYSLDALPRIISNRIIVANDSSDEIVQALYDALYLKDKTTFLRLANILRISTILYRGDVQSSLSSSSRAFDEKFLQEIAGEATKSEGAWSIYNFSTQTVDPYIQEVILPLVNVPTVSEFVSSESAAITTDWKTADNLHPKMIGLQAECYFCSENEYSKFTQSISLPDAKILPESWLYPFLVSRKLTIPSTATNTQQIDSFLSTALLKESEYLKLKRLGKSQAAQDKSLAEYNSYLEKIMKTLGQLDGRDEDIYTSRVLGFLRKQAESGTDEVQTFTRTIISELENKLWVSDQKYYRYGITVPMKGTYRIQTASSVTSLSVNDKVIQNGVLNTYESGYYRIVVPRHSDMPPKIFFSFINSDSSVLTNKPRNIFIFPYTFDTRWKLTSSGYKTALHVPVNGYANGWIAPSETTELPKIEYAPQVAFYKGLFISGLSLVSSLIYLVLM